LKGRAFILFQGDNDMAQCRRRFHLASQGSRKVLTNVLDSWHIWRCWLWYNIPRFSERTNRPLLFSSYRDQIYLEPFPQSGFKWSPWNWFSPRVQWRLGTNDAAMKAFSIRSSVRSTLAICWLTWLLKSGFRFIVFSCQYADCEFHNHNIDHIYLTGMWDVLETVQIIHPWFSTRLFEWH
jgi:hypothetical protein